MSLERQGAELVRPQIARHLLHRAIGQMGVIFGRELRPVDFAGSHTREPAKRQRFHTFGRPRPGRRMGIKRPAGDAAGQRLGAWVFPFWAVIFRVSSVSMIVCASFSRSREKVSCEARRMRGRRGAALAALPLNPGPLPRAGGGALSRRRRRCASCSIWSFSSGAGLSGCCRLGTKSFEAPPTIALDARVFHDRLVEVEDHRSTNDSAQPLSWPAYLPGDVVMIRDGAAPLKIMSYFSYGSMVRL